MDNKKYILQETSNNGKLLPSFVVLLNNGTDYYLTYDDAKATRFDTIGEAMKKSVEFKEKKNNLYKAVAVYS